MKARQITPIYVYNGLDPCQKQPPNNKIRTKRQEEQPARKRQMQRELYDSCGYEKK